METTRRDSQELMENENLVININDIKTEQNSLTHSGLAALAAAAADETAQLQQNSNNKHTNRKTGADMKIFLSYLQSINEPRPPQNIPELELDKHLCSFFMVVRKTDKSEYEPCSLRSMLASIERYLKINGYPSSLTKDTCFANTRYTLKVKQKLLREMGKGSKPQSPFNITSLKDKSLDHVFKAKEMGPYTPTAIAQTLCFVFVVYLRLKKATEHKKLLWGDVVLDKDQNGREYITFSDQMLHRCTLQYLKQCQPVVYALPDAPDRDPVRIYKLYASKRTPTMNFKYAPFYLGINLFNPGSCQSWFKSIAMGINKLNEMVRQVREITGSAINPAFHDVNDSPQDLSMTSTEKYSRGSTPDPTYDMSSSHETSFADYESPGPEANTCDRTVTNTNMIKLEPDGHLPLTDTNQLPPSDSLLTSRNGFKTKIPFQVQPSMDSFDDDDDDIEYDIDDVEEVEDDDPDVEDGDESGSSSDGNGVDDRSVHFNSIANLSEPALPRLSLLNAQKQLQCLLNQLGEDDAKKFENWFTNVEVVKDSQTGILTCQKREKEDTTVVSPPTATDHQIVLNITLSSKAFIGEQPVTVTAVSKPVNNKAESQTDSDIKCASPSNQKSQCIKDKIRKTVKNKHVNQSPAKRLLHHQSTSPDDNFTHEKRKRINSSEEK